MHYQKSSPRKNIGPYNVSMVNSIKYSRKKKEGSYINFFQGREKGRCPTYFINLIPKPDKDIIKKKTTNQYPT